MGDHHESKLKKPINNVWVKYRTTEDGFAQLAELSEITKWSPDHCIDMAIRELLEKMKKQLISKKAHQMTFLVPDK